MLSFLNKLLGGSKSEKDVKQIQPFVAQINQHFAAYASLSNDELRANSARFRQAIDSSRVARCTISLPTIES